MREPEVPTGVRVCASILMLGAMGGVLLPIAIILIPRFRPAGLANATQGWWVIFALSLLPFIWCFWLGYRLWDGMPWTLSLAKWTFFLQIPRLALPGLSYQFDTLGLTVGLSSLRRWHLLFNVGCDFAPIYAPANQDVILGVNLVAIFAASYLFKITAPGYREPKPGDNLGLI